jgi:hypothetical protein
MLILKTMNACIYDVCIGSYSWSPFFLDYFYLAVWARIFYRSRQWQEKFLSDLQDRCLFIFACISINMSDINRWNEMLLLFFYF